MSDTIKLSDVEQLTGHCYITIFRWIRDKGFPMFNKVGDDLTWSREEINQWYKGEKDAS